MERPSAEDLVGIARRHLEEFAAGLPESLGRAWSDLLGKRIGDVDDRYFLHPHAQPLLQVTLWAVDCLDERSRMSPETLRDCIGASAVGYHAVRLQDDLVDERNGDPVTVMLLSTAAFSYADGLIARHVDDERFWRTHGEMMADYGDGMLYEQSLRSAPESYDSSAFDRVLRRSAPLGLPGLAVLAAANAWDRAEAFRDMVHHATKMVQIVNDLRDAPRDLEAGNHTWVLTKLGAGVESELEAVVAAGFDAVVDDARAELAVVRDIADDLGAESVTLWCESADSELTEFQTAFWTKVFLPDARRRDPEV